LSSRVWDSHWHLWGGESGDDVLRTMDEAGLDRISLFGRYAGESDAAHREADDHLARVVAADPGRIYGLPWIEPLLPGACDEIERAIGDLGLRGVKMIPMRWEPCSEAVFPVYERIQSLGVPLQLHSGILFGCGESSRFCRPVLYEALLSFPKLRFSLAHISWPWTDECLALAGQFRAAQASPADRQIWVDCTPGTPPEWRRDALYKAVSYLGPEWLFFGSDAAAGHAGVVTGFEKRDREILGADLGLDADALDQYFWRSAAEFYGEA